MDCQVLHVKNYKTMSRKIKDLKKYKHSMFMDWKTQYFQDRNAIPIQIPAGLFSELEKLILTFMWERKRRRLAKEILRNKVGGLILFNTYYKATLIKTIIVLA